MTGFADLATELQVEIGCFIGADATLENMRAFESNDGCRVPTAVHGVAKEPGVGE
jgi:hypothetical protein